MLSTRVGATSSPMSASRTTLAISAGAYSVLSGTTTRADPGHREPPDDPFDAVGEEQADAAALADALGQQPAGEVGRALLRLSRR